MSKFLRPAAFFFSACLLVGCSRDDARKKVPVKDLVENKVATSDVRNALIRLLERKAEVLPGEPGLPSFVHRPFVVFEEAGSKKFVQISGSGEEPLLFDLPSQPLDANERIRAEKMFGQMGIARQPSVGDEYTYTVKFGKDVDKAALLTIRVFREIYEFPDDFRLSIRQE